MHLNVKLVTLYIVGLIALFVLAFLLVHENGPASFKSNKIVLKLSYFLPF